MAEIYPAILTRSSETLIEQVRAAERFAPLVHIDITDGRFVPARSVTAVDLRDAAPTIPLEIHLMVERPEDVLTEYLALSPLRIIVHKSATTAIDRVCAMIAEKSVEAAVAVSPASLSDDITLLLDRVQQVTFLAVDPGFQGGALNAGVLQKARMFKHDHPDLPMEIDGGVKPTNWQQVLATRADRYVIGSGIWQSADPERAYQNYLTQSATTP